MPRTLTDRARQALSRVERDGGRFLGWWLGELRTLIPIRFARVFADEGPRLRLAFGAAEIGILTMEGETVATVPAGDTPPPALSGAGPVLAVLPRAAVLRRVLRMPAAAATELGAALAFEIDRQTPYAVADVAFRYRVLARDPDRKSLRVELTVVPRRTIEGLLSLAERWGLILAGIRVEDDEGPGGPDFLPAQNLRHAFSWRAERWRPLAACAALMLVLGTMAVSWHVRAAADAAAAEAAAMRETVRHANALRSRIAAITAAARFLPTRLARPRTIELLDTLSRDVPDDTWLREFEIDAKEVRLVGQSRDVPSLIEHLQADTALGPPQYRSPVTHGGDKEGDRFELALALKGGGP